MAAAAASEAKQLREILQEQQEPFVLETYLVEKGCSVRKKKRNNNNNNSIEREGSSFTCCRGGKKGVPSFSKVVRKLYNQVGSGKRNKKKQSSEVAERFSFASSSSKNFNWYSLEIDGGEERASCCSSSFVEFCNSNEEKIAADGSLQWRCMEGEDRQFSPVSVLEGLASHEEDSSPPSNSKEGNKEDDDSIIASASIWEVLLQRAMSRTEATETEHHLKPSNSNALEPEKSRRQLLFDSMTEEMENRTGSDNMMRTWAWIRRSKPGSVPFELLLWSDDGGEEQRREVGVEIGETVLEEIKDEIMVDLMGLLHL